MPFSADEVPDEILFVCLASDWLLRMWREREREREKESEEE
jgi:hypothetical protein